MDANTQVKTTCAYCGVGCGVVATVQDGVVEVAGDESHPANYGRLCSKGSALHETVSLEGRLLYPEIGGQRVEWDEALGAVAGGFEKVIREHGPEAVAFYVSGQLLTEDYYVANKFMKGYIGSANIDTNSRLCMSSAVMGYKRAFGADAVPNCYEDFGHAELIVLVGSNTAWCHPIVFQRIAAAKKNNPKLRVVVIDPRRTATSEIADMQLQIKAGSDVALFNGLLCELAARNRLDREFIARHSNGFDDALTVARESGFDIDAIAARCGLSDDQLLTFYDWFGETDKVVTLFSQGVNQSTQGSDKVNAIINCHLATGRIGKPGMGPFSITGQPNAMGGREVGGLSTTLAAHMDIANERHRDIVKRFWDSPAICEKPGYKAVDLFEAIHDGRVKAVWVMATNPVVSLPDADRVAEALAKCELVVQSDIVLDNDTGRHAHIRLPALGWGEKDGTVTNSERRISRQRAFLPPPGEAQPDWWIICEVAKRMGYAGFDFADQREIFDEHARLSAFENPEAEDGRREAFRGFNIGGLTGLDQAGYEAMEPIQWPLSSSPSPHSSPPDRGRGGQTLDKTSHNKPERPAGTSRLFSDHRFWTPDQRANFIPVRPLTPANRLSSEYPMVLNTGRIRDQWHTMTRTGRSPRLAGHLPEPFVEIHPQDAMKWGVRDGELARVSSRWGACVVRVQATANQRRGAVFIPIHWNDATASDARVGALVNPDVDPVSGEPEFKHTPCRIEPFYVDWHGFVLTRRPLSQAALDDLQGWWVRVTGSQFMRYELGGRGRPKDWSAWGRGLLSVPAEGADWLEYTGTADGIFRAALVVNDRIEACVFVSPVPNLPSRNWLAGLFQKEALEQKDRIGLLAGRSADPAADVGPIVCSCFGVGRNAITRCIREQKLKTPEAIGEQLKAGTNCGSCVPELKVLIQQAG